MKVLLDECVNWRLMRLLPGHDIRSVKQMGWEGIKNGRLLALAEAEFDAFLTTDQRLPSQNSLAQLDLAIVVLKAKSNALINLAPLAPRLLAALPNAPKGDCTVIE